MTFIQLSSETDSTLLASVEFEHGGETYFGSVHQAEHVGPTWDKETQVALPLQIVGTDVRRKLSGEIRKAYFAWKGELDPLANAPGYREHSNARSAQAQMEFE